jgi:hypothetical protein
VQQSLQVLFLYSLLSNFFNRIPNEFWPLHATL